MVIATTFAPATTPLWAIGVAMAMALAQHEPVKYVVGKRIKRAVLHMSAQRTDTKRIAVWTCASGATDADAPVRAADVLDNDGLSYPFSHSLGDRSRDHVGRTARRKRYDHCDGPRRISLGLCDARGDR